MPPEPALSCCLRDRWGQLSTVLGRQCGLRQQSRPETSAWPWGLACISDINTDPSCDITTPPPGGNPGPNVIMTSGGSTALRHPNELRWQPRPLTSHDLGVTQVTDIDTDLSYSRTKTWPSEAAWARHHHSLRWLSRLLLTACSSPWLCL